MFGQQCERWPQVLPGRGTPYYYHPPHLAQHKVAPVGGQRRAEPGRHLVHVLNGPLVHQHLRLCECGMCGGVGWGGGFRWLGGCV